jgi:hypothetical protein
MVHEEKAVIGQVRVPDGTTEATQVKALLASAGLENAVVTADAAHSSAETAQYIAGKEEDGGWGAATSSTSRETPPSLQRACFDAVQASGEGRAPDHAELNRSHGRTVRRSIWVADVLDYLPL